MKGPEIFTRFTATSRKDWNDDITWEDVGLASQGLKPEYKAFVEYVFIQDPNGRHDFFAGLFMDAMELRHVQDWIRGERQRTGEFGSVNKMVLMAIEEWRVGVNQNHTDQSRADIFGVSRSTWARNYKSIYTDIFTIPGYWLDELMEMIDKRLR